MSRRRLRARSGESTETAMDPVAELVCVVGAELTPREREVMVQVLAGKASKVIAVDLDITLETVKAHIKNTYRKLGIRSQREFFALIFRALGASMARGTQLERSRCLNCRTDPVNGCWSETTRV